VAEEQQGGDASKNRVDTERQRNGTDISESSVCAERQRKGAENKKDVEGGLAFLGRNFPCISLTSLDHPPPSFSESIRVIELTHVKNSGVICIAFYSVHMLDHEAYIRPL